MTTERSTGRSDRVASDPTFRFADLFAGIGGIRLAFEGIGGTCVFTSERDKFARQTYEENFEKNSDDHVFNWDVTEIKDPSLVPDHDVLLAGFPCQPFSLAGVSKKNSLGRAHGFEDETQGTLFFDIARILDAKKPPIFLLENVRNLLSHDRGRTFATIERVLDEELGYEISHEVIDSRSWVPQGRKRIIIVGIRRGHGSKLKKFDFSRITIPEGGPRLRSILHPQNNDELVEEPYTEEPGGQVNSKYTLSPRLWDYLQRYAENHRRAGNGFGYGLVGPDSVARTLSARYYKDGAEILVDQGKDFEPRRLTPRECARLMGFPDTFRIPVSDAQAYRQFGNSVVVPMMSAIAEALEPYIVEHRNLEQLLAS